MDRNWDMPFQHKIKYPIYYINTLSKLHQHFLLVRCACTCHMRLLLWPNMPDVSPCRCVGTFGVSGTGPWVFEKKVTTQRVIARDQVATVLQYNSGEKLLEVHFTRNQKHWDSKAGESFASARPC